MLFMVRLFLVAAGMVTVALAMTARGLVPEPEVRTNIGVVPSVGRELVQLAVVPPTQIARLTVDPTLSGASRLGRIVVAPLPELAASPPTSETPDVPPTREQASAVGAAGVAPAPLATKPAETAENEHAAPPGAQVANRSPSAASDPSSTAALTPAPSGAPEPSSSAASEVAVVSPATSTEMSRAAEPSAPVEPPALAFGAEPDASRRTESVAGERTAAAPSRPPLDDDRTAAGGALKAKLSDTQSGSEGAEQTRSSKGKKSARETRRKTAARRSGARARTIATSARKKVTIAKTAPRAKQRNHEQVSSPADLKLGPEPFEYMFAVPPSSAAAPSGDVAAPSRAPPPAAN